MVKKTGMGRPAIFVPKDGTKCVRTGPLTKDGTKRFEMARQRLGQLAGWPAEKVSDSDVVEFLVRGEAPTKVYLGLV